MKFLLCGLFLVATSASFGQQLVCTPTVASSACQKFNTVFGLNSAWPLLTFAKSVQIVVVDPAGFRAEKQRLNAEMERLGKNAKTVGDINRVGGKQAGQGVFTRHELLETNQGFVQKIVISSEALEDDLDIDRLSDELLFYVLGYDQGNLSAHADIVP